MKQEHEPEIDWNLLLKWVPCIAGDRNSQAAYKHAHMNTFDWHYIDASAPRQELYKNPHIDWAKAPNWAQYVAQDENGIWYWYETKPRMEFHDEFISQIKVDDLFVTFRIFEGKEREMKPVTYVPKYRLE